MKPQLSSLTLILTTIVFTVVLMHSKVNAQQIAKNSTSDKHAILKKKSVSIDGRSLKNTSLKMNNINMKAVRDFLVRYKEISNEKWYALEDGFKAEFASGEVTTSVIYKENGTWLHTIRRYYEKNMPKDIRAIVKSIYYGYVITNIQEVQVPNKESSFYFVEVQDTTSIKILRVYEGEMQVYRSISKG